MKTWLQSAALALALLPILTDTSFAQDNLHGWLNWRGPQQNGTSLETGLPAAWTPGGVNDLWHIDLGGGGAPVIANGKLYALGYQGEGSELQEVLFCADSETGRQLWVKRFNDFNSNIVSGQYAIGSPCIDPDTSNVYTLTSAGIFSCFTAAGTLLWDHSMMEEFGRLTFSNGRTGGPLIDGSLVIVRGITSNWGLESTAMDRFYAFDKRSGGLVWSSTPGGGTPTENSFSMPVAAWSNGKRVLYTGTGDGNLVCLNARTGEPIWRYPLTTGSINPSVVLYQNKLIAVYGNESQDSARGGHMVAVNLDAEPRPAPTGPPVLDQSAEAWRNDLESASSSPVLVGDRLYQVTRTGSLCSVDAKTGRVLWQQKLSPGELNASPLYADGKLYVPMQNGSFYIIHPTDQGPQDLSTVRLSGSCTGTPAAWNGKIYLLTTRRLYCFGKKGSGNPPPPMPQEPQPRPGLTTALWIIPAEVLLRPGDKAHFSIYGVDRNGLISETFDTTRASWASYLPPPAVVPSEINAQFGPHGDLTASSDNRPSAGFFQATIESFRGYIRGRVLPVPPFTQNFEDFVLGVPHPTEKGVKFSFPPPAWTGARFQWDVRALGSSKVLAKTLDNPLLQRSLVFIGHPETRNCTIEADLMSEGAGGAMSSVGLINQRYLVALQGNSQELEVSSTPALMREAVKFNWKPGVWYHLKTRVEVFPDGSGLIRAKAFPRGTPEPPSWTIEVRHRHAHVNGAPGLFGFAPQNKFRVYIDNISVEPNAPVPPPAKTGGKP